MGIKTEFFALTKGVKSKVAACAAGPAERPGSICRFGVGDRVAVRWNYSGDGTETELMVGRVTSLRIDPRATLAHVVTEAPVDPTAARVRRAGHFILQHGAWYELGGRFAYTITIDPLG